MGYHYIDCDSLRSVEEKIFKKYGYSDEDAASIADVLMQADLFGIESHGVQRLKFYCTGMDIDRIKVNSKPEVVYETPVSAVIDAHSCSGQLASVKGTDIAIRKAKESGFGMVVIKNSNHYGIAGYYSLKVANEQLIGLSMTNAWGLVLPTYGLQPMMGTNPIALTVPAYPHPFHMDMSTSVVTCGKMEVYAKNSETPPEGWAQNEDGSENRDAARFVRNNGMGIGGLYPLGGKTKESGGHKGYGLCMMVEIMTGIFSGGATSDMITNTAKNGLTCHCIMAINPKLFNERPEEIFQALSEYTAKIRASEKLPQQDRIYVHGDRAFAHLESAHKNGAMLNDETLKEVIELCERFEIDWKNELIEMKPDENNTFPAK